MEYYRERKTMTKWKKDGESFIHVGPWKINRDPKDVIAVGIFEGPYKSKDDE